MADSTPSAADPPHAFGWASAATAALAGLLLPAPGQMGFRYEAMAIASALSGATAAAGVGLGLRALRARIRPVAVAWVGLLGNAAVVAVVAARLVSWLSPGD